MSRRRQAKVICEAPAVQMVRSNASVKSDRLALYRSRLSSIHVRSKSRSLVSLSQVQE